MRDAVRTLLLTVCLGAAFPATCQAQTPPDAPVRRAAPTLRTDRALERDLRALAAKVRGDVGIYVRNLRTGRGVSIRADELFPTASMVKVPIMIAVHDAVARGQLHYSDTLMWRDSLQYPGEDDLFDHLRDSSRLALPMIQLLSITTSDNAASLWLQGLVGGEAVNRWLEQNGFDSTRVNSRTAGREAARARYQWGQTTPREMAELLVRIREGKAVSAAASHAMYRALTRIYWNGESLSQLPPWVQAASKQGSVDRSRSEVVLVNAPSGDYVFCVITKNQLDQRYANDNEGWVLHRAVSALLWKHFEPKHPFTPAEGAAQFTP